VIRRIFGPRKDEVTGGWRKLHNELLIWNLQDTKFRGYKTGGACSTPEDTRNVYKILVGKPEGKRPLGRPRCRWEHNIKMDLKVKAYGCFNWIHVAQDRDRWRLL
jgi:hypothetical protein